MIAEVVTSYSPPKTDKARVLEAEPAAQSICLSMIVKNEAKVIRRCLDSLRGVITCGVICDTGSTDGTQDIIRAWSAENAIPVTVHDRPWVNFGHNRNEALQLARARADFVMLLDADCVLAVPAGFALPCLTHDIYAVRFRVGDSAKVGERRFLLRSALPWRWQWAIHENITLDLPAKPSWARLAGLEVVFGQDGGSNDSAEKAYRKHLGYVQLVERELAGGNQDPGFLINAAQTFDVVGQFLRDPTYLRKALKCYEQALSGSRNIRYSALVSIAALHQLLGAPPERAIMALLSAHTLQPSRAEAARKLAQLFERPGTEPLAILFHREADQKSVQLDPDSYGTVWTEPDAYASAAPRSEIGTTPAAYDHVYLSPHLDDAALSCGGAIAVQRARGERVLVVTVCAGRPPSDELPGFVGRAYRAVGVEPRDVIDVRRAEDRRAMMVLGADFEQLDELDAIYRMPAAYGTPEGLFGEVVEGDPLIAVAAHLARTIAPGALLHAPLGLGDHVDHKIVHAAALNAGRPVVFYEDFPYVVAPGAVEKRLKAIGEAMEPEIIDVSAAMPQRIRAVRAYSSQVGMIGRDLEPKAVAYATQIGNGTPSERTWKPQTEAITKPCWQVGHCPSHETWQPEQMGPDIGRLFDGSVRHQ